MKKNFIPYITGGLIGILIAAVIVFYKKNLGNSNSLVAIAGYIKSFWVNTDVLVKSNYYKTYLIDRPIFEIQFTTILGIILGSFLASIINPVKRTFVPSIWEENFGSSKLKRTIWAYIGGILVGFGARVADGCMSGLGLSSGIKLASSAWIFMLTVFIVGVISANLIYRRSN